MNNAVYRAHAVKSSAMMYRAFALLVLAASAFAQTKPTLLPADYGKWETLGAGTLSPDGKWLAYDVRRTSGDSELRIAPVAGGKTQTVAFCSAPAYSSDSRWLACSATVSEADQEKARKARHPVQNKLAIVDLSSAAVTNVDDVQSFAFAGSGPYVAFRKYAPSSQNPPLTLPPQPPAPDAEAAAAAAVVTAKPSAIPSAPCSGAQSRHRRRHYLRQRHQFRVAGQRIEPRHDDRRRRPHRQRHPDLRSTRRLAQSPR